MPLRVLVTGGAGFIGSHLVTRLLDHKCEVVVLDDLSTGVKDNVDDRVLGFEVCDVTNETAVNLWVRKFYPDIVVHAAAKLGIQRTNEDPLGTLDSTVLGTINVLRAIRNTGCSKLIYISSSAVYGHAAPVPTTEYMDTAPNWPYGVAKLCAEHYVRSTAHQYGLKSVILRPFNVYGPRQDGSAYGFVVSRFINAMLEGRRPVIYGSGKQTRGFTYVDDCVDIITKTVLTPRADGETLNVGSGTEISVLDLGKKIAALCGTEFRPVHEPARKDDVLNRAPDPDKCGRYLGPLKNTSLDEGLAKTIAWYKNKKQ